MVKLLTKDQLQKLTTKRLLAFKNALMNVPEGPNWEPSDYPRIYKSHPDWQRLYKDVKAILATREHIKK